MSEEVIKVLKDLLGKGDAQRAELQPIDDVVRGVFEPPFMPSAGQSVIAREYRQLITRAELPVLNVVIRAATDRLQVDGISLAEEPQDHLWTWWQKNSLDARQAQIYTDSLTYGDGYMLVTAGDDGIPKFTAESPLAMYVEHDPLNPMGVTVAAKQVGDRAWLYTDTHIFAFVKQNRPQKWVMAGPPIEHAAGVCPLIRFPNRLDSSGRSMSEVQECLPIQRRINQTVFSRLLLEASASWRQRWVAGIEVDKDEEGKPVPPFRMGVDKLLVAPDSDTSFGEFSASTTEDLQAAVEQDIRHIAVVTSTPSTMFGVSSISNISSESLAALEGGLSRKVAIKQGNFGESLEYAMQIGGRMMGVAVPDTIEVDWRDLEISSMSQRSNAYVQLRGSGMPVEYLLETTMNLTPQTIKRVMAMIEVERAAGTSTQAEGTDPSQQKLSGEPMLRGQG
jgi:hypothetical protein